MEAVKHIFSLNKPLKSTAFTILVVMQVFVAIVAWIVLLPAALPRPWEVVIALKNQISDGLIPEAARSFGTNLEAIGISLALSLALAYSTAVPFMRPIVALLSKARFFSLVGFTFAFTLLTGGGHALKVSLLVFAISANFVTSMAAVIATIPRSEYEYARSLGKSEIKVVWEVIVLGRAHEAFEVLRQNAAIGWMMLTMVEGLVRSEGGIGTVLLNENKHFQLADVFAIQVVVLTIGIVQDFAIGMVKNMFCPYAKITTEKK